MKAIVCEMCGSQDLVKQDGVYVCQNCGTKYSSEEAKKLFIELTIHNNNNENIESLYKLARRARDNEEVESAYNYYLKIEEINPDDWEAVFYVSYYKTLKKAESFRDPSLRKNMSKPIESSLHLIAENSDITKQRKIIVEIVPRVCTLYEKIEIKLLEAGSPAIIVTECADALIRFGDMSSQLFHNDSEIEKAIIEVYKKAIDILNGANYFSQHPLGSTPKSNIYSYISPKYEHAYNAIKKIDGNIEVKTIKKEGCYIATCVYGSYDCPEVWTLRRFRDYKLAETWYGRLFIKVYYFVSPIFVNWFGDCKWFKCLFKPILDKKVISLNNEGFSNKPYKDKNI